jgi:hypothetical protein
MGDEAMKNSVFDSLSFSLLWDIHWCISSTQAESLKSDTAASPGILGSNMEYNCISSAYI